MPDISRLVIEVDSKGVLKATGDLEVFAKMGQKAGKSSDDLANKMGALQLIANKLPGPFKSVAAGLMGMVNPTTAVISVLVELGEAAVKYIGEAVDAYAEHEAQLVRLGAVVKATGADMWTTTDALSSYADTLQSTMGKSSNQIKQMQSVLLGFTNITGENFNRLTKDMIDMVDVMGGDMVSAASTFGKAMDNPAESLSALSRYGFKFTEQEKSMIKAMQEANDIAGAQVVILKSMEKAFGGAAEAHGKTLQGMKEYVKTLKEQHKALVAEYSGMSDIAKDFNEMQIRYYEGLNNALSENIELEKIIAKEKTGATLEDYYRKIGLEINKLKREIEKSESEGQEHKTYDKQLEEYQELLKLYKPVIDAEKQRTTELEKQLKIINDQKKQYNSVMETVRETLSKTPEGQAEEIQKKINELTIFLNSGKKTENYHVFDLASKKYNDEDKLVDLAQKDKDDINKAIKYWKEQLTEIGKKGRAPFEDWVKILASATGYTEEMVNNLKRLGTVEKYAADVEKIQNTLLSQDGDLINALGLDKIDVLESSADKVRSVLEAMLNSGKWDGTERSVKFLIEKLEQLDKTASDSHFAKIIEDLEKERKLLESSPLERVYNQITEQLKSNNVKDPTTFQIIEYINENGKNYLASLAEQLKDAGESTYDLAVKRLMLEKNITEETAQQAISVQKQIDYITNGYDIMAEITTEINDALKSIRAGKGGYGQYAEGEFANSAMNVMGGSDVGTFVTSSAGSGDPGVGAIKMLVESLAKVITSIEGVDQILNPFTGMLMELKDVFKALLLPGFVLSRAFVELGKGINWLLNFISFGMINEMARMYDSLAVTNDERRTEEERLRALNEQYKNLYAALKEQEEYYLQQRRHLNAEWAIENYQTRSVNDMILSPHGAFSTDPEDYIIATKHPENFAGSNGAAPVYITVINKSAAEVTTQESTAADGAKEIKIIVEGIVQSGLASGKFDSALEAATTRRSGKRGF